VGLAAQQPAVLVEVHAVLQEEEVGRPAARYGAAGAAGRAGAGEVEGRRAVLRVAADGGPQLPALRTPLPGIEKRREAHGKYFFFKKTFFP
jgi:hypothetical protein